MTRTQEEIIASNKGTSAAQLKVSGGPGVTASQNRKKMANRRAARNATPATPDIPRTGNGAFPKDNVRGTVKSSPRKRDVTQYSGYPGMANRNTRGEFNQSQYSGYPGARKPKQKKVTAVVEKNTATIPKDITAAPSRTVGKNPVGSGKVTTATPQADSAAVQVGGTASQVNNSQKSIQPGGIKRVDYNTNKDQMTNRTNYTDEQGASVTAIGKGSTRLNPQGRGATFAERGINPSTGVRRYRSNTSKQKTIEPPKSIGDMIRYKREVQERNREQDVSNKSANTNIAENKIAADFALGARKQNATDRQNAISNANTAEDRANTAFKQKKLDALNVEYADKNTTPERKLDIEREIAVQSGKQPTRPQSKSTKMTDKQRFDSDIGMAEWYKENKKKIGGVLGVGGRYETPQETQQRVMGKQAGALSRNDVKIGEIYIREDGRRAKRKS